MGTTLLATNPFQEDFVDLSPSWDLVSAGAASVTVSNGRLRFALPAGPATSGIDGGSAGTLFSQVVDGGSAAVTGQGGFDGGSSGGSSGSYLWNNEVSSAPRAVLPLFEAGTTASMNNFVVQFKVVAATVTGVAGRPSVGGLALLKAADPLSVLPIIEFGGDSSGDTLAYHSWGGDIGSKMSTPVDTSDLWVRVVRSDNVVYPMVSMDGPQGPWVTLGGIASEGCLQRTTNDAAPSVSYDAVALYARANAADASGLVFEVSDFFVACWPYQAKAVVVADLCARTNLAGKSIFLTWTNPTGENAPRFMSIWRSRYGHPEYKRPVYIGTPPAGLGFGALGEEVYSGEPIESLTETDLGADRFYYYTIFATRAPVPPTFPGNAGTLLAYAAYPCDTDWGPQAASPNKVTGWSSRDMVSEEPHGLYNLFPETYREEDQTDREAAGATSGYLERFAGFLQHGIAHHRALIQGLGYAQDAAQAPLGLIGAAVDQTSIVDAFLTERNVPNLARLDGVTKRRLWEGLLGVYKQKGAIPGVKALITLLTGWRDFTLQEPGLGSSLRGFKTWDGLTTKLFCTKAGGFTYSSGKVSGFTGLTPHAFKGGVYVDFFGNKKMVADNTATEVTFVDSTWLGYNEIVVTGTVTGGAFVQITAGWPFTFQPNDYAYDGAALAGNKSGVLSAPAVLATSYASGGSSFAVPASSFTNGAGQSFALGYAFTGGTFAGRVPTGCCWLYAGEPSWLYNHKSDLSLVGTAENDPFYRTWMGSDFTGIGAALPTGVTDLIVWAPIGAAKFPALVTTSFVDTTVHQVCIQDGPSQPDVQVGDWINPNRAQGRWFRISQIDDATSLKKYRVDIAADGLTPSDVAKARDIAVIATRTTMENDSCLRSFLPLVMPYDSSLFVFYT